MERVVFFRGSATKKGRKRIESDVALTDIPLLRQAIKDTAEKTGVPVKMIVVDPLGNYLAPSSAHKVREVLNPLQQLAEEMNVAIVLIHHLRKSKSASFAHQVSGSEAVVSACRSVFAVLHDPTEDLRYFARVKNNYCSPTAVSYSITDCKIEVIETGIDQSAEELDAVVTNNKKEAAKDSGKISKVVGAAVWLTEFLSAGEKPATEIVEAAKDAGIAERTLERAKKDLNIKPRRVGYGKGSASVWALPSLPSPHTPPKLLDIAFNVPIKGTDDCVEDVDD